MPTTVAAVQTFLGLSPARDVDDDALAAAVAAANDWVHAVRPDLPDPVPPPPAEGDDPAVVAWPAKADQAATLYAARLYGRRGSIQGVAAFAEAGVSLLPTLDPDLRALLELGQFQPSAIA